jgi:hypothetical protein
VIRLMHGGAGPQLLGICEVETKALVAELIERSGFEHLALAHVDSPDIRGIDTSLVYSTRVFELDGAPTGHLMHLRHPTRDVFQVPLKAKANGARLQVFVNHWPSRVAGTYQTEPLRIAVAENCAHLVDALLKFPRSEFLQMPDTPATLARLNARFDANVLLMGDFNDEPGSRSITDDLLSTKDIDRIEEPFRPASPRDKPPRKHTPTPRAYLGRRAYLFNCMAALAGVSDTGTLYYSGGTNTMNLFDHFHVSRGLLLGRAKLRLDRGSVRIHRAAPMATAGKQRPRPFDRKTKKGYSDHFPIEALIEVL